MSLFPGMPPLTLPLAGRVAKLGEAVAQLGRGYAGGLKLAAVHTPLLASLRRCATSCATSPARGAVGVVP
jgi:hypothetical protein